MKTELLKFQPLKNEERRVNISCNNCKLKCGKKLGFFRRFDDVFINDAVDAPIYYRVFEEGETLHHENGLSDSYFVIHQGYVKEMMSTADGGQRITKVIRSGEISGIEVMGSTHHKTTAIALQEVHACQIPNSVLKRISFEKLELYNEFLNAWQAIITDSNDWQSHVNFGSAKQRLCGLIKKMQDSEDLSITTLFSRQDMSLMLDIKMETISREMKKLQDEGHLELYDRKTRRYKFNEDSHVSAIF